MLILFFYLFLADSLFSFRFLSADGRIRLLDGRRPLHGHVLRERDADRKSMPISIST